MRTVGTILDENKGIGPGFDLLRVGLAFAVIAWHDDFLIVGRDRLIAAPWFWLPGYGILVMFFALSGFLIAGSALRLKLKDFLINRGLRIFPALAVEIVLSALILGPIFTSLNAPDYFRRADTYRYFTNIVGLINYTLPGVFPNNPVPGVVNWSLWTIPFELGCYALMSALIVFGLLRRPKLVLLIGIAWAVAILVCMGLNVEHHGGVGAKIAKRIFADRGGRLYVGFLFGLCGYLYRYKLPYDWRIFGAGVITCGLLAGFGVSLPPALLDATLAPILAYLTIFLRVTRLPRLPIFHRGDYSYGVYLYGMPIQQAVRAVFVTTSPLLHLALVVPAVTIFAMCSWHFIEKPILGLRKKFSFVARLRGA